MFHNLRFAIFPLLHSPFFRLVFLLQKENPLIFFGILWIFFFLKFSLKNETLYSWTSLKKIKFLSKFQIFLKLISSILFFGKSLNFYFIFLIIHSFIFLSSIHHFFLKEIYFFWWWVDWVNSIKHELTQKLMWGFNWGGGGNLAPFSLCFPFFFFFLLFFFTLSSSSIVTIHKLLPFFFISTPFLA